MATIDNLPNEVLLDILEFLKGPPLLGWDNWDDEYEHWYDDLRAAALVCSRWREPAQRALFDELNIPWTTHPRVPNFLASPARLRCRTRSLSLFVSDDDRPELWLAAAKACTGLERLTMLDDMNWSLDYQMEWGEFAHPAFAGLKHLSLMAPENLRDPPTTDTPLPFQLLSLSLGLSPDRVERDDDWDLITETSPLFLRALCAASTSSLRKLHLEATEAGTAKLFVPVLRLVGPQLRTLVLEGTDEAFKSHYGIFLTLTSLTRLDMSFRRSDFTPLGLDFLASILDNLPDPPTLTHLGIKATELPTEAFSQLLEHRGLAAVKQLVYEEWEGWKRRGEGQVGSNGVEATRRVCEERGIRVAIYGKTY
ncbi:hypothetical protein RQP46_002451 [Phenoliferia psychrophenolica]